MPTFTNPNSDARIMEKWSDAARAAAAAGRKNRGGGIKAKAAVRKAFYKAGGSRSSSKKRVDSMIRAAGPKGAKAAVRANRRGKPQLYKNKRGKWSKVHPTDWGT